MMLLRHANGLERKQETGSGEMHVAMKDVIRYSGAICDNESSLRGL